MLLAWELIPRRGRNEAIVNSYDRPNSHRSTDFPAVDVKFTQDLGKLNIGVIQYYHT
jgi:hypothetical protein